MVKKRDADLVKQFCERKYREAVEEGIKLEQKRLNDIFVTLGSVDKPHFFLSSTQEEFSTLGKVRSSVEAGDRKAMLELLGIVANTLLAFKFLSKDIREALADGLKEMQGNLENSKEFLPRRLGQRPADPRQEFSTAMAVEYHRRFNNLSLDEAIAKVEEEGGKAVQKRWKRQHKKVNESFEFAYEVLFQKRGLRMDKLLPKKKMRVKKVR